MPTINERVDTFVAKALALRVKKIDTLSSLAEARTISSWEKARLLSEAELKTLFAVYTSSSVHSYLHKNYVPALKAAGLDQPFTHIVVNGYAVPHSGYMRPRSEHDYKEKDRSRESLNNNLTNPCTRFPLAIDLF